MNFEEEERRKSVLAVAVVKYAADALCYSNCDRTQGIFEKLLVLDELTNYMAYYSFHNFNLKHLAKCMHFKHVEDFYGTNIFGYLITLPPWDLWHVMKTDKAYQTNSITYFFSYDPKNWLAPEFEATPKWTKLDDLTRYGSSCAFIERFENDLAFSVGIYKSPYDGIALKLRYFLYRAELIRTVRRKYLELDEAAKLQFTRGVRIAYFKECTCTMIELMQFSIDILNNFMKLMAVNCIEEKEKVEVKKATPVVEEESPAIIAEKETPNDSFTGPFLLILQLIIVCYNCAYSYCYPDQILLTSLGHIFTVIFFACVAEWKYLTSKCAAIGIRFKNDLEQVRFAWFKTKDELYKQHYNVVCDNYNDNIEKLEQIDILETKFNRIKNENVKTAFLQTIGCIERSTFVKSNLFNRSMESIKIYQEFMDDFIKKGE